MCTNLSGLNRYSVNLKCILLEWKTSVNKCNGGSGCCLGVENNRVVVQDLAIVLAAPKVIVKPYHYEGR